MGTESNNNKAVEKQIAQIFECDVNYAHKIIASIKMNLPIQGATPKQMYKGYELVMIDSVGGKDELPPKGFARIHGAESQSFRNELVELPELDKRIKEIMDGYTHEDDYNRALKYIWLRYDDGTEEQMCDRVWNKKND